MTPITMMPNAQLMAVVQPSATLRRLVTQAAIATWKR